MLHGSKVNIALLFCFSQCHKFTCKSSLRFTCTGRRCAKLTSATVTVWPWPEHNKQPIRIQMLHYQQAFSPSNLPGSTQSTWRNKKGKTVRDGNQATGLKSPLSLGLSYWFCGVKLGLALHMNMYLRLYGNPNTWPDTVWAPSSHTELSRPIAD